ncbi:MAG: hypothetical protein KA270_15965 [Saprospiraceae bacterium]|jgi:hypothetical protein|nr:hypothetical protein [Saprospiraceae bacterium]MBP6568668.1 hypothetical protein [Saprospiraceae bacterium]
MFRIFVIFGIICTIFHISCSKDEVGNQDTYNTKINFISPAEDSEYTIGDTIIISAVITSDVSMHGYEILIHNTTQKNIIPLKNKHTHGKEITLDENWIVDVKNKTDLEIEIVAAIDHLGNQISAIRKVKCN